MTTDQASNGDSSHGPAFYSIINKGDIESDGGRWVRLDDGLRFVCGSASPDAAILVDCSNVWYNPKSCCLVQSQKLPAEEGKRTYL
jgi:hypothetical protein